MNTTQQPTLTALFTLSELTSEEAARWESALDLASRLGGVPRSWLGARLARRLVDLRLLADLGRPLLLVTDLGLENA